MRRADRVARRWHEFWASTTHMADRPDALLRRAFLRTGQAPLSTLASRNSFGWCAVPRREPWLWSGRRRYGCDGGPNAPGWRPACSAARWSLASSLTWRSDSPSAPDCVPNAAVAAPRQQGPGPHAGRIGNVTTDVIGAVVRWVALLPASASGARLVPNAARSWAGESARIPSTYCRSRRVRGASTEASVGRACRPAVSTRRSAWVVGPWTESVVAADLAATVGASDGGCAAAFPAVVW